MRKSAHITLSITPLFRDLRTDLLWQRGQMLSCPKQKLIKPGLEGQIQYLRTLPQGNTLNAVFADAYLWWS